MRDSLPGFAALNPGYIPADSLAGLTTGGAFCCRGFEPRRILL
jgi:hypothetical protein